MPLPSMKGPSAPPLTSTHETHEYILVTDQSSEVAKSSSVYQEVRFSHPQGDHIQSDQGVIS